MNFQQKGMYFRAKLKRKKRKEKESVKVSPYGSLKDPTGL